MLAEGTDGLIRHLSHMSPQYQDVFRTLFRRSRARTLGHATAGLLRLMVALLGRSRGALLCRANRRWCRRLLRGAEFEVESGELGATDPAIARPVERVELRGQILVRHGFDTADVAIAAKVEFFEQRIARSDFRILELLRLLLEGLGAYLCMPGAPYHQSRRRHRQENFPYHATIPFAHRHR